jgi:GNAT superfamily N-acetyltransferase
MAAAVTIRYAEERDLDALLELFGQLADQAPDEPSASVRAALEVVTEAPFVHLLVAEEAGRMVGTVELIIVPNVTHGGRPWAQLENMVVDERIRGLGVGQALLGRCEALAQEHGCYKIQLQSANHRAGAHLFYEAFGFAASSKGFRLYIP